MTYGETLAGMTFPTSRHSTNTYKGTSATFPSNFESVERLKSIKISEARDSDFLLSAFGLPEPDEFAPSQPTPTPRYVWFLCAAGVFVLLAALLFWFPRRVPKPQSPEIA